MYNDFVSEHKDLQEQFIRQLGNLESYYKVALLMTEDEKCNSFYGSFDGSIDICSMKAPIYEAHTGEYTRSDTDGRPSDASPEKASIYDLSASNVVDALSAVP